MNVEQGKNFVYLGKRCHKFCPKVGIRKIFKPMNLQCYLLKSFQNSDIDRGKYVPLMALDIHLEDEAAVRFVYGRKVLIQRQ